MRNATAGQVHARVQAGGGSACGVGPEYCGGTRTLGLVEQTLFNWVKAIGKVTLKGAGGRTEVTAEQMEISRLRAELARVTMERDILGKAMAYFRKGPEVMYGPPSCCKRKIWIAVWSTQMYPVLLEF